MFPAKYQPCHFHKFSQEFFVTPFLRVVSTSILNHSACGKSFRQFIVSLLRPSPIITNADDWNNSDRHVESPLKIHNSGNSYSSYPCARSEKCHNSGQLIHLPHSRHMTKRGIPTTVQHQNNLLLLSNRSLIFSKRTGVKSLASFSAHNNHLKIHHFHLMESEHYGLAL